MNDGLVIQRGNAQITTLNPAAERMLGLAAAELIGQPADVVAGAVKLIQKNGSACSWETLPAIAAARDGMPVGEVVIGVHRPDGGLVWLAVNSQPLIAPGATAPYPVASILRDISEREAGWGEGEKRQRLLEHQKLIQTSLDGFWVARAKDARILEANEAFCSMLGYSHAELLAMCIPELEANEAPAETAAHIRKIMLVGHDRFETRHRHKQGHLVDLEVSTSYSKMNGGEFFVFVRNITERKRAEKYEQFRSHILELMSGSAALTDILQDIVRGVEQLNPEMLCSILLLDSQGEHLGAGIAPSLPDFYNAAIDGIQIGLGVGSCGTAAASGERVIVDDIQTHPYWAPYKELAARAGLRACWSEPIRSSNGQVLGTFAIYHCAVHSPAAFDIAIIEKSARLASIAIERKRAELERQAHARALECMEQVNNAIQGTTDLDQMMADVLDVVLSSFDCDRAFLLYPCDPHVDEWHVPMERTRPEYPGAFALGMHAIPMDRESAGIVRATLDAAGPVMFGPGTVYPLPATLSEQFGFKSEILMAVHPKLDKPWVFGIHQCSHARVWTEEDAALFQKIGWRLSDALSSLLMYRNLHASEQQFRTLAENLPDILIRYDREGHRTYVNPALERFFSVSNTRMMGLTPQEANPVHLPETYQRALQHTLATGERSEFEMELPSPSGDARIGYVYMVAERAADGGISGAITIGRDITKIKQAEQQLRELAVHLQSVREEEKARLAREIHDDLGSTLAALKLRLSHLLDFELAEDMKSTPLFARLESMSPLLESAIAATRRIITDMRPDVLDNLGLFAALKWQAEQFHKHTGIGCRIVCANDHGCVDCRGCVYQLDKTLSINLFRVFQEALTNIARHSGASSVAAEYRAGDDEIFLSVSDNGYGLPEGHTPASGSFGIRGMRERVGQLGGEIRFDTPSGGGLRVTVRVPMRAVAGDA